MTGNLLNLHLRASQFVSQISEDQSSRSSSLGKKNMLNFEASGETVCDSNLRASSILE